MCPNATGEPVENAYIESFNGRFRDERLSELNRPEFCGGSNS
ncbi:integrase core domain-containing protein [Burkholderia cepacia]